MYPHYYLHVFRVEGSHWKSSFRGRPANLYVEVKLGSSIQRTKTVKKSPVWNEVFTFTPSNESGTLQIRVKHKSMYWSDPCVGAVDIKLVDLLAKSTSGEAALSLSSQEHTNASTPAPIIVLHLEVADVTTVARNSINGTSAAVRSSKIQRLDGASDVTQSISDEITHSDGHNHFYKTVGKLVLKLNIFMEAIDTLSEVHPFLAIACSLASVLYTAVKNVFEVDQKVLDLVQMMVDAFSFVCDAEMLREKATNLHISINGLLKQTIECCLFVRQYVQRSFLKRMLDLSSSQKIDDFERALASFRQQIDSGVALHNAFASMRTSQKLDDISLLQRLNPSQMDGFLRPDCLAGTRTEIRTQIMEWVFSASKQNIFWLHGVAGSGKSTISTTIANHFREMSRLGAFLFFERGKSEPSSVIRTIAYKLALFDPTIGSNILTEIENDKDIATASPQHQFNKLLLQPLLTLESLPEAPVIIVLDALDECGTAETRRGLMKLLHAGFPKLPKNFRFLITSRQEADINRVLASQPETTHVASLDYTSATSRSDVSLYLRTEMREVIEEQVEIPEDWPWEESMGRLGTSAEGLFIWAATAVRMVKNSDNPFYRLDCLVSDSRSLSAFGLDELYSTVLRSSGIEWDDEKSRNRFKKVLSLLLLSKVPLTSKAIDGILRFTSREPSLLILSKLRSLITYSRGGPVTLLHASFSDYLTSPERVRDPWFIDTDEAKHYMTDQCFSVMKDLLRFNICDFKSSFVPNDDVRGLTDLVKTRIPSHLDYACVYWVQHLLDTSYSADLRDKVLDFARHRLLYWFEVLSLTKMFCHVAGRGLAEAALWSEPYDTNVASFLRDASKLATIFTLPVARCLPHIYTSMIPLSENDSDVAKYYSRYLSSVVRVDRRGVKRPPMCLKVLGGYDNDVNSVVFSPDGRLVVSGSWEGTVRLWDIDGGEAILALPGGRAVCFSPDGQCILSGSLDHALRVWDARTGELILGPLVMHTNEVFSVAWSPDGTRIASGSVDKTIIIRNAADGKPLFSPLRGHNGDITSLSFSPDSALLASASCDKIIMIWDVQKGELAFRPFEGHVGCVESVAFAPDGKHIVSGSKDRTINIWDVASGSVISTLDGHAIWVSSVSYSPCGTRIISSSFDNTIKIWDAESGKIVSGPLEGHTSYVYSAAYSPDGKYIASGSSDKTVRIWDATTRTSVSKTSARHTVRITSIAFSPDGRRIASASDDQSIIVWGNESSDVSFGPLGPLLGHTMEVNCVVFSPDGSRVFSGSLDGTIRTWDALTGESFSDPLEHTDGILCIAVSPDGATVVSGSDNNTIHVWNTATRRLIVKPLCGHSQQVNSVAFSSNGKRLASGSDDGTIIVWDTKTWQPVSKCLIGHTDSVCSVCFSPDGTQIASGSLDGSIIVWDAESFGRSGGPFEGHESCVEAVLFSVDGKYVVSGSRDNTIRIWNVESGSTVRKLEGHTSDVNALALSPDGLQLASGSDDNTIRVWDISDFAPPTGQCTVDGELSSRSAPPRNLDWVLEKDGWLLGGPDRRDLLLWVPPDLRTTLWGAHTISILSCDFVTTLDFTGAALGERWDKSYSTTVSCVECG